MYYFILAIIAGLSWGICTLLEKYRLLKYYKPYDLIIIRSLIMVSFFFVTLFKDINVSKNNLIKKVLNMDKNLTMVLLLNSFISILGTFLFFFILRKNKVVNTVSTIYAVSTASPIILAYLFFNEVINIYQAIGTVFIIIGLYMVNFKV